MLRVICTLYGRRVQAGGVVVYLRSQRRRLCDDPAQSAISFIASTHRPEMRGSGGRCPRHRPIAIAITADVNTKVMLQAGRCDHSTDHPLGHTL